MKEIIISSPYLDGVELVTYWILNLKFFSMSSKNGKKKIFLVL